MFRFTIRELVLVTLIVALGLGWWLDRSQLAAEQSRRSDRVNKFVGPITDKLYELGYSIDVDRQSGETVVSEKSRFDEPIAPDRPPQQGHN